MARASRQALASTTIWVHAAMRAAEYAGAWGKLVWSSLEDFQQSQELLRTPLGLSKPESVAAQRRRGAEQVVILLDRHGLLPLLMLKHSHQQAAERIGALMLIDPSHVASSFRDAQQDQIRALKEALDHHLSDEPGPSDLSLFGVRKPASEPGAAR